ncbi:MAG: hypothetical protein ACNA7J_11885 [Wenzhouxiangella sp.]
MRKIVLHALMLLSAGHLVGCAGVSSRSDEGAAGFLVLESHTALEANDDDNLLQSQVQADSVGERVRYSADYSLRSEVLAHSLSADAPARPSELGGQSIHQQLHLELPQSFGAPVTIDLHNHQDVLWSFSGEQKSDSSGAHLQWKPSYLALDVHWTAPREMVIVDRPLDCHVQANVRLATWPVPMRSDAALDISQQDCQVLAPFRGVYGLNLQSQGLAWRWGESLGNGVRFRKVLPQWQTLGIERANAAYEFGLIHHGSWSDWQLGLDLAWRQVDENLQESGSGAASNWAVDLMVGRNLGLVALSARWLRANDPLWFMPLASAIERERLSLLIDFSSWLVGKLPRMDASLSASWEQVEDARGTDDNQLKWNFQLAW